VHDLSLAYAFIDAAAAPDIPRKLSMRMWMLIEFIFNSFLYSKDFV
jgi:hypothetical protein